MPARWPLIRIFCLFVAILASFSVPAGTGKGPAPIYVGLDAEFGYAGSTSAEAVRAGMLIAIEEVNRAGGVLGGRPLALVERPNGSVPARSQENIKELAAMPGLVAVFCGRFSPTVLDSLSLVHSLGVPLLNPWAAADSIIDSSYYPNYAFRLSLRDSWAMPVLLRHAERKGARRVGLMLLNTAWGRSSLKAAEAYAASRPQLSIAGVSWFNWTDNSFAAKYRSLLAAGAQAIILVGNDEAHQLIREVAALPRAERLPIISHWGIAGGGFVEKAGDAALREVDLAFIQSYSFIDAASPAARRVAEAAMRIFGVDSPRRIPSPVGVAQAYDLTRIVALAIERAGSTDRRAVRDALEQVRGYRGLIRTYDRPFTAQRHEALEPADFFMAQFASDHAIVRTPVLRR